MRTWVDYDIQQLTQARAKYERGVYTSVEMQYLHKYLVHKSIKI